MLSNEARTGKDKSKIEKNKRKKTAINNYIKIINLEQKFNFEKDKLCHSVLAFIFQGYFSKVKF